MALLSGSETVRAEVWRYLGGAQGSGLGQGFLLRNGVFLEIGQGTMGRRFACTVFWS